VPPRSSSAQANGAKQRAGELAKLCAAEREGTCDDAWAAEVLGGGGLTASDLEMDATLGEWGDGSPGA
jgi:hypothetical protein